MTTESNHWQNEWARRNQELLDLATDLRLQVIRTLLQGAVGESEAERLIREDASRTSTPPAVRKGWRP